MTSHRAAFARWLIFDTGAKVMLYQKALWKIALDYGVCVGTLRFWIDKGKAAGDPCPLDAPALMPAWLQRNTKPMGVRNHYARPMKELADRYGVSKRTVTLWAQIGRESGDRCPLDEPEKMGDWWQRNMKIKHQQSFYPFSQMKLAKLYGVTKRAVRVWLKIGRTRADPCPLDNPLEMLAWWRRNMKKSPPAKLLIPAAIALE